MKNVIFEYRKENFRWARHVARFTSNSWPLRHLSSSGVGHKNCFCELIITFKRYISGLIPYSTFSNYNLFLFTESDERIFRESDIKLFLVKSLCVCLVLHFIAIVNCCLTTRTLHERGHKQTNRLTYTRCMQRWEIVSISVGVRETLETCKAGKKLNFRTFSCNFNSR